MAFTKLTGKRFGRLRVIGLASGLSKEGRRLWWCLCRCGSHVVATSKSLTTGNTKSCGCARKKFPVSVSVIRALYREYQKNAKKRGVLFRLTKKQFRELTAGSCTYCGCPPSKTKSNHSYNGVDRIDSSKGYTIDNCVSCCYRCNVMKSNLTTRDFVDHIRRVFRHVSFAKGLR